MTTTTDPNWRGIVDALVDHQHSIGFFRDGITKHEPKNRPADGLTAATFLSDVRPIQARSGLATTSLRIEGTTRIYLNMLADDGDEIDPRAYDAAAALMHSYSIDFTLGGLISNIDLLGAFGEPLRTRPGYLRQSGGIYRVLDTITPCVINDVFEQIP